MNCSECGRHVDMRNNPPADQVWCSTTCHDTWFAARPEEAAKWTAVRDLSAVQLAELRATVGDVDGDAE